MATTPNYSWVMPDPTDYVTDLPADFEIFGDAVDATVKSVSDAQIPKSIVDAKGDIIAATAADTVARVAVGANGQVLTADSGASAGVAWTTPATGAAVQLNPVISGGYLRSITTIDDNNSTTLEPKTRTGNDETELIPIYLPNCTLDRIAVRASLYVSTGDVRLGIYNNGTNNLPSTLLLDAGTVSITGNGNFEITINQTITAGWYWLASNAQSGSFSLAAVRADSLNPTFTYFTSPSLNGAVQFGWVQTGVSGALPNPVGTLGARNLPVIVWVRTA
jgi:hypothetical protein